MEYQKKIINFFAKMNMAEVKWLVVAEDGTKHPFTNKDIIKSLESLDNTKAEAVLKTLDSFYNDSVRVNTYLKSIAKQYCDMRFDLIRALTEDFKKADTIEMKAYFYGLLKKFDISDLRKAEVFDEFINMEKVIETWVYER